MSPVHREGDGTRKVGPTWQSLVERLIAEAQERGDFDDLPLHGRPLPDWDDDRAGDMRLAYHVLRNAGVAPPWIEADKEVRRLLDERDRILERGRRCDAAARPRYRRELERVIGELDDAIQRVNGLAPTPGQQRRRPNLERELSAFDAIPPAAGMDATLEG